MRQTLLPLRPGRTPSRLVLTRSQQGQHKLYSVPAEERSRVRALAGAWRRYQRARARLVKQTAALLALADRIALAQKEDWP